MDLFGEVEEPKIEAADHTVTEETPAETFTHPRSMNFCLGHEALEQKLIETFKGDRPPHGLILAGPKGIGKATLAYRLAKYLFHRGTKDPSQSGLFEEDTATSQESLDIDPESAAARQVSSGGHPDLMSIERLYDPAKNTYKASVEVSEIRKVTPFLRMTASNDGWRIVIIDDADTMNRNAQNALLKILEEPPANTLIILVTHRLGALIPTIRSRTQLINVPSLDPDVMSELLRRTDNLLDQKGLDTLIHLSEGCFGKTFQYIELDVLDLLRQLTEVLDTYPSWNWPEIHALADNMGRAGAANKYSIFTELMQRIFSDLALVKARGHSETEIFFESEALKSLLKNSSLEQLLKICENLHNHFMKVDAANLDKRQGVLQAFSLISA